MKISEDKCVKGMNFIICHELQDLNDSYMKACFLKCFTDTVSSVVCFLGISGLT